MKQQGILNWAGKCYGIDAGRGSGLSAVVASRSRGRVVWKKACLSDENVLSDIKEGRVPVAAAVSVRDAFVRKLQAPFRSAKKAFRVFPTLLDIDLPFPVESCQCRYIPQEPSLDGSATALAVGVRVVELESRLKELSAHSVDPVILDHEGIALFSQCVREIPAKSQLDRFVRIIVNMNDSGCSVAVGMADEFLGSYSLSAAEPRAVERILKSYESSLSSEGMRIKWMWSGAGLDKSDVDGFMRSLSPKWHGDKIIMDEPELFLARALAVRALAGGVMPLNLRQGDFEHGSILIRDRKRRAFSFAALFVVSLTVIAANVMWQYSVKCRLDKLDNDFYQLRDGVLGYELNVKGQKALDKARSELDASLPFYDAFRRYLDSDLALDLFSIAEKASALDIVLNSMALSEGTLSAVGNAPDWNTCDALSEYVEASGFTSVIRKSEADEHERIPFTLTAGGGE